MKWRKLNRKRPPKTGRCVFGSWVRDYYGNWVWSMSGPTYRGLVPWVDDDRTHYIRLPEPPKERGLL